MTAKTQLILSLLPVLAAGVLLSACVTQTTDQGHFLETSRIAPEPNAGMAGRSGLSSPEQGAVLAYLRAARR